MLFRDLYKIVEGMGLFPVHFDFLKQEVIAHHVGGVEDVALYPIKYDPPNGEAYIRLEDEREAQYSDEFLVASVLFCESLRADLPRMRFVLTKELMHVFDDEEEKAGTADRFRKLLSDIQNKPLTKHASKMYLSEMECQWKAVLLLCPKVKRDTLMDDYVAKRLADFDIAQIFAIPEWLVSAVMHPYYDQVYNTLVIGQNGDDH